MTALKLSPISVPKTSDVLAGELRRQILTGAIAPGTPLPAERDLVLQTGLSRGSVREALRVLETEHLVTIRSGRHGGPIARQPGDESLAKTISLFVHGRGITLLALMQSRLALEPSLAALAASHRTETELQDLIDVTDRVERAFSDTPLFLSENVQWHCAIAAASHNELLRAFMLAISGLIYKATAIENFASDDVRNLVIAAHRRILEAIQTQDADAAQRRMTRHLAAVTAAVRAMPDAPLLLN